jgi:hypothetical protein
VVILHSPCGHITAPVVISCSPCCHIQAPVGILYNIWLYYKPMWLSKLEAPASSLVKLELPASSLDKLEVPASSLVN